MELGEATGMLARTPAVLSALLAGLPVDWVHRDDGPGTSNDRLIGLVVHELRTPVAIIKAYAELLQAQAASRHSTIAG